MPLIIPQAPPLSIYVHIPWCIRKCPYCDFNSYSINSVTFAEQLYLDALELDFAQELPNILGRTIENIFIGGGTPSLISPLGIARIINHFQKHLIISPVAEITLEANPGTVDQLRLADFKSAGINRLSLGIQSFDNHHLLTLGRIHDSATAFSAYEAARQAGFENINLDLMFGIPGQNIAQAKNDLNSACILLPEHISYYQFTIEPQSAFYANPPPMSDEDILWIMHEQGMEVLQNAGYEHYEISAYTRQQNKCRHNLNYWEFGDYLGLGAGAHGKITHPQKIQRRWKIAHPQDYLAAVNCTSFLSGTEYLTPADLPVEFMLNALRLVTGVPSDFFLQRTHLSLSEIYPPLNLARNRGWLDIRLDRIMPTNLGQRFLNEVLELFLPEG